MTAAFPTPGPEFLEKNRVLDEIIEARRSVRAFAADRPPKEYIESIVRAGMSAPYPAIAVSGQPDFRRFFVFQSGTPSMERAVALMAEGARRSRDHLKKQLEENPSLINLAQPFLERLEAAVAKGIFVLGLPPYFVVVAELKGIPASARESIAHVLENMWLKATALGLGFQLISLTSQMADGPEFPALLGIPAGRFELNGCAVGYAKTPPAAAPRPDVLKSTRWMP